MKQLTDERMAELRRQAKDSEQTTDRFWHHIYADLAVAEFCRINNIAGEAQPALKIALDALNSIASWDEGKEVGKRFDEPGAASIARAALASINSLSSASDDNTPTPQAIAAEAKAKELARCIRIIRAQMRRYKEAGKGVEAKAAERLSRLIRRQDNAVRK